MYHNKMASTCLTFLFVVQLVAIVFGFQQEITLYTEADQGGDAVLFRSSKSDLSDFSYMRNNTKSYCASGLWVLFELKDFGQYVTDFGDFDGDTRCGNYAVETFNSIRHAGASNTSTQALSLYEDGNLEGREHFITSESDNNFPLYPVGYVSSGKTVWTFFEGLNFDGRSTCTFLGDLDLNFGTFEPLDFVRSVVKGCGAEAQRNIANYKLGFAKNL